MPKRQNKKSTNTNDVTKKIVAAAHAPKPKPNYSVKDAKALAAALDAFRNLPARMGQNTPSLTEGTEYELVRWSNDYWLMVTMFRNHWISRKMVAMPSQDMCKAWPRLKCDLDPVDIGKFDRTIRRTVTPQRTQEAIQWGRLFGGAGALICIDGHEDILDKPLDYDEIMPGAYKGLIVFDRWSGISPLLEIVDDLNYPIDYGLPRAYQVKGQDGETFEIHHSRIMRFVGPDVPYPEKQAQLLWGISVLEPAFEEMRKRDNASWSILQLLFRAQILCQVNPELASMLSGLGGTGLAAQKFFQTYQAQNELLSNQSMLILGKEGSLQSHQYTFGGIADVLNAFEVAIAGASDGIPFSRLFGKSVSGLNQTNEGDEKMYEENISMKQNSYMRPQLDKAYPAICMSEFGEIPEDLDLMFPSIRVLTEKEKSELHKEASASIIEAYNAGIWSQQLALMEYKELSDLTGIGTNITDEMIQEADDKPITPLEIEQEEARAGTETFSEGPKEEPEPTKSNKPNEPEPDKTAKPNGKGKAKDSADTPMNYLVGTADDQNGEPLTIQIENVKGEVRTGPDYQVTLPADYGYISGTKGADGDEVDCYIGPLGKYGSDKVYIVNQKTNDRRHFDEHKCMIGYASELDAMRDYWAGHHKAREVFMNIIPMNMNEFKEWLATHDMRLPAGEKPKMHKSVLDSAIKFFAGEWF
jgi:phage-related protein (TIGR01555 family)